MKCTYPYNCQNNGGKYVIIRSDIKFYHYFCEYHLSGLSIQDWKEISEEEYMINKIHES